MFKACYNKNKRKYMRKWDAKDDKTQYFDETFIDWLKQLPQSAIPVVFQLLDEFLYYSQDKINKLLFNLHIKLTTSYLIDNSTTIYTCFHKKNGIINSSIDYFINYKNINCISKYHCYESLKFIEKNQFESIVVIDDFCGSGNTLRNFVNIYLDILKDKTIYYVVIHAMSESITDLELYCRERSIDIQVVFASKGIKAFSKIKYDRDPEELRQIIIDTTAQLGIPNKYTFGYKDSECLVAFYNNTPNNTIGLFWHDTENYFSIFPRDFKKNTSQETSGLPYMIKQKRKRKSQNYAYAKRGALNGSSN